LIGPEQRRRTVDRVRRRLGPGRVSQRRVCRTLGQPRSTQRYRPTQPEKDGPLLQAMRRVADARPRFGCERVHPELLKSGWTVGLGRVHRLWKQEHMQVPRKQRKRRRLPGQSGQGCVRYRATGRNHVWSYDFLAERTEDGRQLKILAVLDEFTRECLATEVARSFTSRDVMLTLQYLFAVRSGASSQRQRARVRRARHPTLAQASRSQYPVHQQGQPVGERLRGIVQRQIARRAAEPRVVPEPGRGAVLAR